MYLTVPSVTAAFEPFGGARHYANSPELHARRLMPRSNVWVLPLVWALLTMSASSWNHSKLFADWLQRRLQRVLRTLSACNKKSPTSYIVFESFLAAELQRRRERSTQPPDASSGSYDRSPASSFLPASTFPSAAPKQTNMAACEEQQCLLEDEDQSSGSREPDRQLPAICDPSRLPHRVVILVFMCFLGFGERFA